MLSSSGAWELVLGEIMKKGIELGSVNFTDIRWFLSSGKFI
jgi:hypothetical protein